MFFFLFLSIVCKGEWTQTWMWLPHPLYTLITEKVLSGKKMMLKIWSQAFCSKMSCILLCQVNNRGSFVWDHISIKMVDVVTFSSFKWSAWKTIHQQIYNRDESKDISFCEMSKRDRWNHQRSLRFIKQQHYLLLCLCSLAYLSEWWYLSHCFQ